MLIPLTDKKKVKELENTTIAIDNIIYMKQESNREKFELICEMQAWYHKYKIPAGTFVKSVNKLKELIGTPIYYVTYRDKNALWAFKWEGYNVLLYRSKRGLALQVDLFFPPSEVIPLLRALNNKLYNRRDA